MKKIRNNLSGKSGVSLNRKSLSLFIMLFWFASAFTQSDNWPLGTRAASMGNAFVAESELWSVHHNQAGLGFYPYFTVGFHHENKFIVDEYNLHALALTVPVKKGSFGFSYSYFGYQVYNETKAGLAYGKQFGNGFSAGVQINYHYNYIEGEYGNRSALSFEGGIQYKPGEQICIGAHISNPTRSRISANLQDTIPTYFNVGFSYYPFTNFRLNLQVNKRLDYDYRLLAGTEYMFIENLFFRLGYMTNPNQLTFGLGYKLNKISADIGFTNHSILGFTPHFSFQARIK